MWPFIAASGVTLFLVSKAQDAGVKCACLISPLLFRPSIFRPSTTFSIFSFFLFTATLPSCYTHLLSSFRSHPSTQAMANLRSISQLKSGRTTPATRTRPRLRNKARITSFSYRVPARSAIDILHLDFVAHESRTMDDVANSLRIITAR